MAITIQNLSVKSTQIQNLRISLQAHIDREVQISSRLSRKGLTKKQYENMEKELEQARSNTDDCEKELRNLLDTLREGRDEQQ